MPKKKKSKEEQRRDEDMLASQFRALGDPTRLRILGYLNARCGAVAVEDGDETWMRTGPTVGEVSCAVSNSKKITALVSHHLKEMRVAGLIAVKRRGKNMICGVQREALAQLCQFLEADEPPGSDEEPSKTDEDQQEDMGPHKK